MAQAQRHNNIRKVESFNEPTILLFPPIRSYLLVAQHRADSGVGDPKRTHLSLSSFGYSTKKAACNPTIRKHEAEAESIDERAVWCERPGYLRSDATDDGSRWSNKWARSAKMG